MSGVQKKINWKSMGYVGEGDLAILFKIFMCLEGHWKTISRYPHPCVSSIGFY